MSLKATQMEWAEKYRPNTLSTVIGNGTAIATLKTWGNEWLHGIPDKKAVILSGSAGVGKTSSAHALANDLNWNIIELNASDTRTAGVINRIAGNASKTQSLDGISRKLIILDEADNIHGNSDRGGAKAMISILKETNQPIILIVNDLFGVSSSIRILCKEIKFNAIQSRSILSALKEICRKENIIYELEVLMKIAMNASGDLRSAINDLQAITTGKNQLHSKDFVVSSRDTKESVFKVISKIFTKDDVKSVLEYTYKLDENPEDLIHWIDENLPFQYANKDDVQFGYKYLSSADRFLGRVKRRQNYGMWKYASMLMVGGVLTSKSHKSGGFLKLKPPSIWRKLGALRTKRARRDDIASKIGKQCHESMRYSRTNLAPIYAAMLKHDEYSVDITSNLDLTLDELVYMTDSKKPTKRLQKIYETAELLKGDVVENSDYKKSIFSENKKPKSSTLTSPQKKKTHIIPKSKKAPQKTLFDF
ncbi:MAG: replication factor C large subunit [Methanosarcinaceae archaeon]|nr:replication factor C large subunit [Methanosarcinaceae archaeon]